ncbi:MAG: hypothetical protein FJ138_14665, partial [Deltaproteobacteria bacterium]|nr:hypothetical protein [Deltaproteobacteria bacterium]
AREEAARAYHAQLSAVPWLRLPSFPAAGRHSWQSFVVLVDSERAPWSRDVWMSRLWERGVETRVGTTLLGEGGAGARLAFEGGVALPLVDAAVTARGGALVLEDLYREEL